MLEKAKEIYYTLWRALAEDPKDHLNKMVNQPFGMNILQLFGAKSVDDYIKTDILIVDRLTVPHMEIKGEKVFEQDNYSVYYDNGAVYVKLDDVRIRIFPLDSKRADFLFKLVSNKDLKSILNEVNLTILAIHKSLRTYIEDIFYDVKFSLEK